MRLFKHTYKSDTEEQGDGIEGDTCQSLIKHGLRLEPGRDEKN